METLKLDKLVFAVTLKCNLQCKHCCPKVPYLKQPWVPTYSELMQSIEDAFYIVDEVNRLEFSGGEPLLRSDLPDLVSNCLKYKSRVAEYFRIITNGTIVPSDSLIKECKKWGHKVNFMIDDYGSNISIRVPEIVQKLKTSGIPFEVRNYTDTDAHFGGWVDVHIEGGKRNNKLQAEENYKKCNYVNSLAYGCTIVKSRLYACKQSMLVELAGWEVENPDEYVDFSDKTTSREDLRIKLQNLYNKDCLNACQYCDGFFNDSPRIIPAIQLTPDELDKALKY